MIYLNRQEQRIAIFLGVLLIISIGVLIVKRFQPAWVLRITMGEPDFDAKEANPAFDQRIYIPSQKTERQQISGEYNKDSLKEPQSEYKQNTERTSKIQSPIKSQEVSKKININTADKKELEALPAIGPVRAQKIIDYRKANNGFKSIDELINVEGIGEKTLQKIKDAVTIGD